MTDSSTLAQRPPRRLRRIPRTRGETRETILEYEGAGGRIGARLVRVEGGGVDRTTGAPLTVYFELTVKLPGQPEVTRTFTGQGDPVRAEWNVRCAYLMAQHGTVDFTMPLGGLGPRLWPEPKNLTALWHLRERHGWPETLPRTRMNSGDSHAEPPGDGGAAPPPRPARSEAHAALPWWAGSEEPVWPAPGPRPEPLDQVEAADLTLTPA